MTETPPQPGPGLYPGVSRDWYDQVVGVNYSYLKHFRFSPLHARQHRIAPPDQTKAMSLGSAEHAAVLYPGQFDEQFAEAPKFDKRTKVGKEGWAKFEADSGDRMILTDSEMQRVKAMQKSVWLNTTANGLLTGKGANEMAIVWDDAICSTRCKGLIDRMSTDREGYPCIIDVKTAKDVSDNGFSRAMNTFAYHIQAAMYLRGAADIEPIQRRYYFIAVENHAPFDCRVLRLNDDAIEQGTREVERYLRLNDISQKSGVWPGTGNGLVTLPPWGFDRSVDEF
jgi:hypothetical protein